MAEISVRTMTGASARSVTLADSIFGVQPNVPVMHQVVTAQLAKARSGTQSTLTRSEVRGGGKKPWRQKGTGRARHGSTRSPIWTGGGVALGPKPRKYDQKTPKKMIALALKGALSDRASEGKVVVIDGWNFDKPSTKSAVAALKALGVSDKVLVVIGRDDEDAFKSFRNLTDVQVMLSGELNTYDVLNNDWIVFTEATLPQAQPEEAKKQPTAIGETAVVEPAVEVPETPVAEAAPQAAAEMEASE